MNRSLQGRLLIGAAAVTALALAAAALAIYFFVRASLLNEFDASLAARAHALASITEHKADGIKVEFDPTMMPEFSRAKRPDYFVLWASGRQPVARSASAAETDFTRPSEPQNAAVYSFLKLPDGHRGRAIILAFLPHPDDEDPPPSPLPHPSVTLLLARHTNTIDHPLNQLALLLFCVTAAAALLSGGLMLLAVRRGLRPVDMLAFRIASVGERNLSARLDSGTAPRELRPVVDRLNDLLSRLESAFIREKSFSADVAHELRTPLAGLEAALEVCATRRREPEAYEQTVTRCLATVRDMHAMVEKLLLLARFESHQLPISPQSINLGQLLTDCYAPLQPRAAARNLSVEFAVTADLTLQSDPAHLRIILHNLLDNAVTYANDAGRIHIHAEPSATGTALRISNTGSVISSEDAEKTFQRFWRADASRTQTGLHCGLGLSLSRRIAQSLGGSLNATSTSGGTFEVTLTLPSTPLTHVAKP